MMSSTNTSSVIRKLLQLRGIASEEDIKEYLSPKPQRTYDPFLMKGMKEAVKRILYHAERGSRICIYGDYDCDGVTAVFLMTEVLKELTDEHLIDHYLPSRFREGYGLNKDAIDKIAERKTDLLITVDCGISQAEEAAYAESLGIEVIITDHHNTSDIIPDCIVLDPKQQDCPYPFDSLCGCGVCYKLAQALQRTAGFDKSVIHRLLDIAGIATIGDVVPLTDENRTIAKYGLYEIRSGRRENIRILLDKLSRGYAELDSYGVSFGIVPCINAAGRMGDADNALALLRAENPEQAEMYASCLSAANNDRKSVQEEAYKRGIDLIEEQCPDSTIPVIRDDLAHEGIIGIVAGKLSSKLYRPVIVLTEKDGKVKGSGRSIEEVDLYSIVSAHSDMLERFGGHRAACGLTLKSADALDDFRAALEGEMEMLLEEDPGLLDDDGRYDLIIEPSNVNLQVAEEIECMEPFGNANEKPAFKLENVHISRGFLMGSEKNHLKFIAEKDGYTVECVAFFAADEYGDIVFKEPVCDIIGRIAVNEFRGRKTAQFVVDRITEQV